MIEDGQNIWTVLRRMTGTFKYMAIELLDLGMSGARPDLEQTCRHDLESLFYVFLSTYVTYGWDEGKAPKKNPFRSWYAGDDYRDKIITKRGAMERGGFKIVVGKFSPKFETAKELAWTQICSSSVVSYERELRPVMRLFHMTR